MIELMFVACLSAQPTACQDRSLLFTDDVSVMTCMMAAQAELARWARNHPAQQVRRWTCRHVAEGNARA
ncbi:MAG: hypothetical protein FJX25_17265 [Alphaproteobacteria bacterium]|nr:hypothetical protein [Alphaproteobacteria bacterium]